MSEAAFQIRASALKGHTREGGSQSLHGHVLSEPIFLLNVALEEAPDLSPAHAGCHFANFVDHAESSLRYCPRLFILSTGQVTVLVVQFGLHDTQEGDAQDFAWAAAHNVRLLF